LHGALGFRQFLWLWNRAQGMATPALHLEIAGWLEARWRQGDRRLLLLVFRGAGKSTLLGVFVAWLLLGRPELRILVLAAEQELARKMVRTVRRTIERHPLTRALIPKRPEQWAGDQFTVRRSQTLRDPSLLARGIGANVTGSRADVAICDDVEVPNTSGTGSKRAELRARLAEIAYVLVPGGLQVYAGTPHTLESIYTEALPAGSDEPGPFLQGFRRLVLPVLDEAGRSRWPERFPLAEIERIRSQTGPAKFESQMLLRPRPLEQVRLDPDRLVRYDAELSYSEGNRLGVLRIGERRMVSATAWWDPAFGSPKGGDASVVAALFTDERGLFWLHAIRYLEHDPRLDGRVDQATQLCRQVAAFAHDLHLPAITVETNGLGRFLPALLRRELATVGIGCAVLEHTSRLSKVTRILDAFDPVLAAAALHAHASVWRTPFIREMRDWRPSRDGADDGLDAVAGCLLAEPARLRPGIMAERPSWRGMPVAAETRFEL
jgi:hypothetical protein